LSRNLLFIANINIILRIVSCRAHERSAYYYRRQFPDITDFFAVFFSQILMVLCANVIVLGPGMGLGYSAVAEPAMTAVKTNGDLQLDANQANGIG